MPPPQELPHCDEDSRGSRIAMPPPPRATAGPAPSLTPRRGCSFSSPPRCSFRAEPRWSATWPMINTARCGLNSSPFGGGVVPIHGHARRRHPGPGGPPCGGYTKWVVLGSGVRGGGGDAGFAARPSPPLCRAEYASVTAGRTPGVTDQDLRRSKAWLGNRQHLVGVIRAVVTGPPPQVHCRGCSLGEHLAGPLHGAASQTPIWIALNWK
jgi:hypothetical protein